MSRILEAKMATTEESDAEKKRWSERNAESNAAEQKRLHREAKVKRIKDIVWSAVIASVVTIIVVTSLGWLTTQAVVEKAREQGAEGLVALRVVVYPARFQQRPDAAAKLAEFKALPYGGKDTAIKKFIADEKLATMVGENAPA